MARALRIERPRGRYHITSRGNESKDIFRDDTDRFHFLELLGEMGERFGASVHAYVLMDNHYHLLLETPEPNLSRALHWTPKASLIPAQDKVLGTTNKSQSSAEGAIHNLPRPGFPNGPQDVGHLTTHEGP